MQEYCSHENFLKNLLENKTQTAQITSYVSMKTESSKYTVTSRTKTICLKGREYGMKAVSSIDVDTEQL